MDCNKEEALRAKELAEKKMLNNDFEGAKKVAAKAERLYPQLENMSQLHAVCNVHCSAQNNIVGSERDWYGILQIDRFSDEVTIKKQYRRLALVLHPDKNKLPGAEAAFKLIGEANMVLSDPVKKSSYDSKLRVFPKAAVSKQPAPHFRPTNNQNGFTDPFSNLNFQQHTQPTSARQDTFWTQCPSCKVRYQYYRIHVNNALRCQKCQIPFMALDLGPQAVSSAPKSNQHGGQPFDQKELPNHGTSKMPAGSAWFTHTSTGSGQGFSSRTVGFEPEIPRGKTAPVFENIRTKRKDANLTGGTRKGAAVPKVDRKSRKRRRKQTVESSESDDISTSVETESLDFENGSGPPTGQVDGYGTRRSSRRRQHVSYNEIVSDDESDLASSPKKAHCDQSAEDGNSEKDARAHQSTGDSKPQQEESVVGDVQKHGSFNRPFSNSEENSYQNGLGLPVGNMQKNNSKVGTANEQPHRSPSVVAEKAEVIVDSDSEADKIPSNPQDLLDYPDPEFSDFDKHKAENCFSENQVWACYDTTDGMPRFYAHIRKVFCPEFKVKFIWLEAHPEDKNGAAWVKEELPVGCGKFRRGSMEVTSDRLIFSHQVQCDMGERGRYIVYPKKGETWALFKDWDVRWSSDPDNHRKYKYEVVEILSDYVAGVGVHVGWLDKVSGFVSLFQRTKLDVVGTFFIKPEELYKFSHRVPSFKMSGTEREGVPVGSVELDPASLPLNPDDIWYPSKFKGDSISSNSEPVENVLHTVHPVVTRDISKTQKSGDLKSIHATDGEAAEVIRSRTGVNISEKKQSDEEVHSCTKSFSVSNSSGSSKNPITLSDDKCPEEVFCDFGMDRSMGKFQVEQIWALYCQNSTLPKIYVQIKKIVPVPFELHVVLLEACAGPKRAAKLVCGTFKVQNEKHLVYVPSSFSHVVKAVPISRNRFEIYPREGEIWALYKNWKKSGLDPDKIEYEIVEVIEYSKDLIKALPMVRVDGFKSVFRSPGKQRPNSVILEIQKDEFGRFSHQIPAFQLTGEKGGVLRGCWELAPASVPSSL